MKADGWWDHPDDKPHPRRCRWENGRVVEWWGATLLAPSADHPSFIRLPPYLRTPFGAFVEAPLVVVGNGSPLTTTVNSTTINPVPQPPEGATMSEPQLVLNPLPAEVTGEPPAEVHPVTKAVAALLENNADLGTLTKVYLQIRDKKKDLDTAAKLKTAPLSQAMTDIENRMLDMMNQLGADNVKTPNGTPYISTTTSITMADPDPFWRFVLAQSLAALPLPDGTRSAIIDAMLNSGALALVEDRPAKAACEQYLENNKALPPGLNSKTVRSVNVRAK